MNVLRKLIVSMRQRENGQTMTEYVLIIAAIAVAGYVAYQGLEGGINTIITTELVERRIHVLLELQLNVVPVGTQRGDRCRADLDQALG